MLGDPPQEAAPRAGVVYQLVDPQSGAVRYVGKTVSMIEKRMREHLSRARSGAHHPRVHPWLRSVGLEPTVVVLEEVFGTLQDLSDAEVRWIALRRGEGCDLVNHTDGGEGAAGYRHDAETRAKMSAKKTGIKVGPVWVRRALSPAEEDAVVAQYAAGASLQKISDGLGGRMTGSGVRKVLERRGVERRNAGAGRWLSVRQSGVLTPHQAKADQVVELYMSGLASNEVGDRLEMSGRTVLTILKKRGVKARSVGRKMKQEGLTI